MKYIKKITALLLIAVMIFTLAACNKKDNTESHIDKIKAAGKLVVGTSADYPPYEGHIEIGGVDTIAGFEMDIAKHWADSLGVELEIIDMSFENLIISLSQGQFDVVIAGMTADEERLKSVDFTDAYLDSKSLVLIRTADAENFKTVEDLKGKKAGAQTGAKTMEKAIELTGEETTTGISKVPDLVMELKAGKLDVVYLDYMVALAYGANNEDLTAADLNIPSTDSGYQAAVQKGDTELAKFLSEDIAKMKEEGLIDKYIVDAQNLFGVEE